jgi:hypothetical protein
VRHIKPSAPLSADETLPNFTERKHRRKGEKRKQGARTEVQAIKQPNKGGPRGGNGATKNQTLHQSHEANPLKKVEANPKLKPLSVCFKN